jgi:hypothetical protein
MGEIHASDLRNGEGSRALPWRGWLNTQPENGGVGVAWRKSEILQSAGQLEAANFSNRTIAVSLQQFYYLTTKHVVIK